MTHATPPIADDSREPQRRRRSLRRILVLAGSVAALSAHSALADLNRKPVDECLEGVADVRLPSSATGGSIDVQLCADCGLTRLTIESDTRFLIGKLAVTYPQLLEAAAASSMPVAICYRPQSRTVTRLKLADPQAK